MDKKHELTYDTMLDTYKNYFGAVELADGSWLHNDGAVCWVNEDGNLHREDGPALIRSNNAFDKRNKWRLDGNAYTFDEWCDVLGKTDEDKMLLRLQYG